MGWIATAASALIAVMFVYNWYNNKAAISYSTTEETSSLHHMKPMSGKIEEGQKSGEEDVHEELVDEIVRPTQSLPIAVTLTEPETGPTAEKEHEKDNNQGRAAVTLCQSTSQPLLQESLSANTTRLQQSYIPMTAPSPSSKNKVVAASATRSSTSPPRLRPPTFGGLAPAPPRPNGSSLLRPPPSAASSLRVPPTKVLSNTSMAPSPSPSPFGSTSSMMPPPALPTKKPSQQVILEPGHSPLDWAALANNPRNNDRLRGKDAPPDGCLIRVTPSRLKTQNGRRGKDAWTVYQGKVYNVTPYVPFHPGGKGEILRGAGKDSARLFMEVHPWVNWDGMLGECCIGILVSEDEGEDEVDRRGARQQGNVLDEMD